MSETEFGEEDGSKSPLSGVGVGGITEDSGQAGGRTGNEESLTESGVGSVTEDSGWGDGGLVEDAIVMS